MAKRILVIKNYQVWQEGMASDGEPILAGLLKTVDAPSFKEACDKVCSGKPGYNSKLGILDGRKLFDNEQDARALYG